MLDSRKMVQVNPHFGQNKAKFAHSKYRAELAMGAPPRLPEGLFSAKGERVLKPGDVRNVSVVDWAGERLVLKRFARTLRDRIRPDRARRAYAAAKTLEALGLPTLDVRGVAARPEGNYFAYRFIPDAVTARDWIQPRMHRQSDGVREAAMDVLLTRLVELYHHGLYHADTKTENVLVVLDGMTARSSLWVDLEDLAPARLTRRRLFRNLAQLNGSLCRRISRRDRLQFLERLAEYVPGAREPGLAERVEALTRVRLARELSGERKAYVRRW